MSSRVDPAHPSAGVIQQEQTHRRLVAFTLAALLLLGLSPLVALHVLPGLEERLAGRDHLWALCVVALQVILTPVHGVFHLLLLAGLVNAVLDRMRAWTAQRVTLSQLALAEDALPDGFLAAARAVGLEPRRIRVVEGLPSPAFTAGWLRPHVYVAARLGDRLTGAELEAVLAHEAAHLERRDPLRLSLLRFLACLLFWLPAVRRLTEDLADEAEIRADDRAARGRPLALASALLSLARWAAPEISAAAGFAHRDLLERRVRRLAGEAIEPVSRLTRRSVLGAVLALSFAWTSAAVMAHPSPNEMAEHETHCKHQGTSALFHLFCLGQIALRPLPDCPHRSA